MGVLHVNVTGVMLCCRAVTPTMREARWGRIINISSGSISLGRPNYLHYTTSKSALVGGAHAGVLGGWDKDTHPKISGLRDRVDFKSIPPSAV
jgi:hypothetical protein